MPCEGGGPAATIAAYGFAGTWTLLSERRSSRSGVDRMCSLPRAAPSGLSPQYTWLIGLPMKRIFGFGADKRPLMGTLRGGTDGRRAAARAEARGSSGDSREGVGYPGAPGLRGEAAMPAEQLDVGPFPQRRLLGYSRMTGQRAELKRELLNPPSS